MTEPTSIASAIAKLLSDFSAGAEPAAGDRYEHPQIGEVKLLEQLEPHRWKAGQAACVFYVDVREMKRLG